MIGITDLPLKIIAFYKHVNTYLHACGHMTYNCFVEIPTGALAGHDSVHVSEHITLKKYGGMHGPENFHHLKTNKQKKCTDLFLWLLGSILFLYSLLELVSLKFISEKKY